jgi:hypothetical protein
VDSRAEFGIRLPVGCGSLVEIWPENEAELVAVPAVDVTVEVVESRRRCRRTRPKRLESSSLTRTSATTEARGSSVRPREQRARGAIGTSEAYLDDTHRRFHPLDADANSADPPDRRIEGAVSPTSV